MSKKKSMIFKIQRPIVTDDPEPKCLIYNQDRSITGMIPFTEEIEEIIFESGDLKRYFKGSFNPKTGQVTFGEFVEEQDW